MRYAEKHLDYINKYNRTIREQLHRAMEYHGLDISEIEPETIEHVKKCLGQWDFDGHYKKFLTLGAKRYLVQYSTDPRNKEKEWLKCKLTVSGLNKQIAIYYLCNGWYCDIKTKQEYNTPFEKFHDDLYIPPEYTGKNTHTYIDERRTGIIADYLGNITQYDELSGVHLEKADYSLSLSREYLDYILSVETIEI